MSAASLPAPPPRPSRREQNAEARKSRRPSRLGTAAGAATTPDYSVPADAGFPGLLKRTWSAALSAEDAWDAVELLLGLDGHVPVDVRLRALPVAAEAALRALFGLTWREDEPVAVPGDVADDDEAFLGELGLTTSGRVVVRLPAGDPLAAGEDLVDGALRVRWSSRALAAYRLERARVSARMAAAAADCRAWLAAQGPEGRDGLLNLVVEAATRTAPFVLYQDERQYTNFRDRNNITGKTLWPGHPDCAPSTLRGLPLELWSDGDASMVVCLALLVRSAGFARVEEANGTQLTVEHVGHLLERARCNYNAVVPENPVPRAPGTGVVELVALADALGAKRKVAVGRAQLYREIHGALIHKIERVAGPVGPGARERERRLSAHLRSALPVEGADLAALGAAVAADPAWLAAPHGGFGTGIEALVHAAVAGATDAFETDFSMSRGLRSLPRLVAALAAEDFDEIASWEIKDYFCCVVPSPAARRHFGDSVAHLADTAWAMSSRMRYNSWHFIAGNLPRVPAVLERDHFVPPSIPDVAFYSDQHHNGHVAAKVRFSIRSPQAVTVLGREFKGFMDVRLLRCSGEPFTEQDLLAAHRLSGFIAGAMTCAATLAAQGAPVEVTSFDSQWHWRSVTGTASPAARSAHPFRVVA